MQRDIKPGIYETISDESIGTFVLDEWQYFKIDSYYKFLLSDIVIKEGSTVIPSSNYELAIDTDATTQESGLSGKSLYGQMRVTNIAYTGVELNVSGFNFGGYVSNESDIEYVDDALLSKTETSGSNINEGELVEFAGTGQNIKSSNSGSIALWDVGTIYNTKGTLVRREGITYTSTGKTTNQGIDPSDPDNANYWYEPDSARDLKRQANRCAIIDGGFHIVNDRSDGAYTTTLRLNKTQIGGVNKEFYMLNLDGSVVTGNTTLENLLSGNPYIDLIAPEVSGTRTLIDMSSTHIAPMSDGGENDVLGSWLENRFQGHYHSIGARNQASNIEISIAGSFGDLASDSSYYGNLSGANLVNENGLVRDPIADRVNTSYGDPRVGTTTRPNELTVGISHIVVMVGA